MSFVVGLVGPVKGAAHDSGVTRGMARGPCSLLPQSHPQEAQSEENRHERTGRFHLRPAPGGCSRGWVDSTATHMAHLLPLVNRAPHCVQFIEPILFAIPMGR